MKNTNIYLKSFILGSSLVLSIFPLSGLAIASSKHGNQDLSWLTICIFFPVVFGFANAFAAFLKIQENRLKMLLMGAVLGLFISSYGVFVAHIPERVYDLHGGKKYLALLGGPIFYGLVWLFPMSYVNRLFKN